jgi:hypothetical protein
MCRLPVLGLDQVVQLDQVDVVDAHALQGAFEAGACTIAVARVRLRREKEPVGMRFEPRRDPQFSVAVHCCGVDVVDAMIEQQWQQPVGCLLISARDAGCAEDHAGALVTGPAERRTLDHSGIKSNEYGDRR